MKNYLIFAIYLYLIKNKYVTAKQIAKHFEISERSVYRYIDALSLLGIQIVTKVGRNGGIEVLNPKYLDGIFLSNLERQIIKEFIEYDINKEKVKTILNKLI